MSENERAESTCEHRRIQEHQPAAWLEASWIKVRCRDCGKLGWLPLNVEWHAESAAAANRGKDGAE